MSRDLSPTTRKEHGVEVREKLGEAREHVHAPPRKGDATS
jgi:hypothetical protein